MTTFRTSLRPPLATRLRSRYLTRLTGLIPIDRIDETGDAIYLMAYEDAHSMGDEQVEQRYRELAEIVLASHGIPA